MKYFQKIFQVFAFSVSSIIALIVYVLLTTPNVYKIRECLTTELYQVKLCPGSKDYVSIQNISASVRHAIIVSEDAAFYSHNGFDWSELKSSFETNLRTRRFARGGSTITQQLAKNVFLTADKSILRKIREAILSRQIEEILSKDQILERYFNVVEFGPGIFGIKKAAQYYFQKTPAELNTLDASYLAHLLPNPKVYSRTYTNKQLTPFSRGRVLDINYRLFKFRIISEDQYNAGKEYVDKFPWTTLSAFENDRLNGSIKEDFDYDLTIEFPEQAIDETVVPEEEIEEVVTPITEPTIEQTQPFDN